MIPQPVVKRDLWGCRQPQVKMGGGDSGSKGPWQADGLRDPYGTTDVEIWVLADADQIDVAQE
ncbi:MAG TPA: hypothetical protein VJ935_09445, partial [Acidimicrobiia bacterium]|nr:hypothetical protein [Acidimicrobiia bacterium]